MLRRAGVGPVVTMHHAVDPSLVDRDFVSMHRVRAPHWLARLGLSSVQRTIASLARTVIVHEGPFADVVPGAAVVPHGLEPTAAAAVKQLSAGPRSLSDRRLTAICFGFLAPYKGLEQALEAASLTREAVQLVIAGDEHPRLKETEAAYAADLQARWPGVAQFGGYVEDEELPAWFAAADVALFLYPRPFAASGALALALAHGTPVLLSSALAELVGAPPELVAPASAGGLARRLEELAGDATAIGRLRDRAEMLTRDRSWDVVARRHAEIYEEVNDADGTSLRSVRTG
jgi:glycosyltransferase involved in cell wall biosynthesis